MKTFTTTSTEMVCTDCYIALVNGDPISDDLERAHREAGHADEDGSLQCGSLDRLNYADDVTPGLTHEAVADRLGITESEAWELINDDPDAFYAAGRDDFYRPWGGCSGCGCPWAGVYEGATVWHY